MDKVPESIESTKFNSHKARTSGEFDSKIVSQPTKLEQRPQILLKLGSCVIQSQLAYIFPGIYNILEIDMGLSFVLNM